MVARPDFQCLAPPRGLPPSPPVRYTKEPSQIISPIESNHNIRIKPPFRIHREASLASKSQVSLISNVGSLFSNLTGLPRPFLKPRQTLHARTSVVVVKWALVLGAALMIGTRNPLALAEDPITYDSHVAKIVRSKCGTCHGDAKQEEIGRAHV